MYFFKITLKAILSENKISLQKLKIHFHPNLRERKIYGHIVSLQVLTNYLLQTEEPSMTSYFVKYADVENDQKGMSHFNWVVGKSNYHILRTGCFPYIKYHCSKRPKQDLSSEDKFFKAIKIMNLGTSTFGTMKNIHCIRAIPETFFHLRILREFREIFTFQDVTSD